MFLDYQKILDQLVSGEIKEYEVKPEDAFELQKTIRNYGKRQYITGRAKRGDRIVYTVSIKGNEVMFHF